MRYLILGTSSSFSLSVPLFPMYFGVGLPSLFSPLQAQLCYFRLQSRPLQVVFNSPHPSSRRSTWTSLRLLNFHDVTYHMLFSRRITCPYHRRRFSVSLSAMFTTLNIPRICSFLIFLKCYSP